MYQEQALKSEITITKMKLHKCFGTHSYLQTLRKNESQPDPCPICKSTLEQQWNVFTCGHTYCLDCVQVLIGRSHTKHIACSVCRELHHVNTIMFVQKDKSQAIEDSQIKGNCSTKVFKVVEKVKEFLDEDNEVKVLVFSNFQVLLKILKNIFDLNNIACEILSSHSHKKVLNKFKNPEKKVTVLLLPINLGSKGLNLIEATKVIFVEPILNPADEYQAIGRVHRIGQTKYENNSLNFAL